MDLDPERLVRSPFVIGALGSLVALRGAFANDGLSKVLIEPVVPNI